MKQTKAGFLVLELINEGVTMPEIIGQLLAGYVQSGGDISEAIAEGAAGLNRFAELAVSHSSNLWPELIPGGMGPHPPAWEVVAIDTVKSLEEDIENLREELSRRPYRVDDKQDVGQFGENSVLPYALDYHHGDSAYHCPKGATFFTDEQGHQWVKFFPANGTSRGLEHMFRVVPTQDYVVRTGS